MVMFPAKFDMQLSSNVLMMCAGTYNQADSAVTATRVAQHDCAPCKANTRLLTYAMTMSAGTYNPADSEPADKCRECPPGTTTAPGNVTAAAVDNINDCSFTLPGFGVQDANELNAGVIKQAGLRECDVGEQQLPA